MASLAVLALVTSIFLWLITGGASNRHSRDSAPDAPIATEAPSNQSRRRVADDNPGGLSQEGLGTPRREADTIKAAEQWPPAISVDCLVDAPAWVGRGQQSGLSNPGNIFVKGAVLAKVAGIVFPEPGPTGGTVLYRNVFVLKPKEPVIAVALFAVLDPPNEESNGVSLDTINCFAAHRVLTVADLNGADRIVLSHSAPSLQVTLKFDSAMAGKVARVHFSNINGSMWLDQREAASLDSRIWPSSAGPEFFVKGGEDEYSLPDGTSAVARATVGKDGLIRVFGLPHGFGLPGALTVCDQGSGDDRAVTLFAGDGAGARVANRFKNQVVILPRENESVSYVRTANDLLPQIVLEGSLARSRDEWPRFRVFCRLPSNQPDSREGVAIAAAQFSASGSQWQWTIETPLDVQALVGSRVFYTLEKLGTACTVVEGLLAPHPDVMLAVQSPRNPWIVSARVTPTAGNALRLPISFSVSFGAHRPMLSGESATDDEGKWSLGGIEGPLTEQGLREQTSFEVEINNAELKRILETVLAQKTGRQTELDVTVNPDTRLEWRTRGDFTSRTLETQRKYFYITVREANGAAVELGKFMKLNNLTEAYAEEIAKYEQKR